MMKRSQICKGIVVALMVSACTGNASVPPTATKQSAAPTYMDIPTRKPFQTATPIPTLTATSIVPAQAAPPAWVADFADPILERAADQYPTFQDDFTLQLNHGWYYFLPNSRRNPVYAHLEEDSLILRIPDGNEYRDSMVYSPKLARKNFVLSIDFKFGKTEPNDILRFQFTQNENEFVNVDLVKNETSALEWNLYNHWRSVTGIYDYFGPALVNIVIIMSDHECAVFINHDPFGYLSECRADPIRKPTHEAVSIHLLSTTGYPATVTIDNVKLWDLDGINFVSP